jgi:hypothetical protein
MADSKDGWTQHGLMPESVERGRQQRTSARNYLHQNAVFREKYPFICTKTRFFDEFSVWGRAKTSRNAGFLLCV